MMNINFFYAYPIYIILYFPYDCVSGAIGLNFKNQQIA
jgi:hypothetical protein